MNVDSLLQVPEWGHAETYQLRRAGRVAWERMWRRPGMSSRQREIFADSLRDSLFGNLTSMDPRFLQDSLLFLSTHDGEGGRVWLGAAERQRLQEKHIFSPYAYTSIQDRQLQAVCGLSLLAHPAWEAAEWERLAEGALAISNLNRFSEVYRREAYEGALEEGIRHPRLLPEGFAPRFHRLAEVSRTRALQVLVERPERRGWLRPVDWLPLLSSPEAEVREWAMRAQGSAAPGVETQAVRRRR